MSHDHESVHDGNLCIYCGEYFAQSKAADSGTSLTLENLDEFVNSDFRGLPRTLVAPSKAVAEQWAKQYPGWTIVLSSRVVGAKRPTHPKRVKEK